MTMVDMKERYGVKVGLSDHTMGYDVAVAAVALGATLVEKHFILDRAIGVQMPPFLWRLENSLQWLSLYVM